MNFAIMFSFFFCCLLFSRLVPEGRNAFSGYRFQVGSDQFIHRLTILQQILWTTVEIGNCRGGIYSENVVKCRQNILRGVRTGDRVFTAGIGRPNILSHLQPAAGEEHAASRRPVVTATKFVDPRSAPELPP